MCLNALRKDFDYSHIYGHSVGGNGDGNGQGKRLDLSVLVEETGKRLRRRMQDEGRSRLPATCPQHTDQCICGLLLPSTSFPLTHFFLHFSISLYTVYLTLHCDAHQHADRSPSLEYQEKTKEHNQCLSLPPDHAFPSCPFSSSYSPDRHASSRQRVLLGPRHLLTHPQPPALDPSAVRMCSRTEMSSRYQLLPPNHASVTSHVIILVRNPLLSRKLHPQKLLGYL